LGTTNYNGRFRFGINAMVGPETISQDGASSSATMFGVDLRLGWQLNDMFAVYAQPHLSFGTFGGLLGSTGTYVGTVMGEATFMDRFFVGAGLGYGVFNNPSGFAIEARAGGYPLMGFGAEGGRRKGLMVGVDFKNVFLSQNGVSANGMMITGTIGYEAF